METIGRARRGVGVWVAVVALSGCSGAERATVDEDAVDVAPIAGDDDLDDLDAADDTDGDDDASPDDLSAAEDGGGFEPDRDRATTVEGPLQAGAYRTDVFGVPAEFDLEDGSWHGNREGPYWLGLFQQPWDEAADPDPAHLSLLGAQLPVSFDEMVARLESMGDADDDVTVLGSEPTSIGGLDGTLVRLELSSGANFTVFRTSMGDWIVRARDRLVDVHVLDTGAQPFAVYVNAERDEYDDFVAVADPVIASFRFR